MPSVERAASVDYPGDGSTVLWDFNFQDGYLDQAYVKAKVINDITKLETPVAITASNFEGPYRLRIEPAVQAGYTLRIYRDTPAEKLVEWPTRARIDRDGLSLTLRQPLHVAAENSENQQFAIDAGEAAAAAAAAAEAAAASIEGDADRAEAASDEAATSAAAAAVHAAAVQAIYQDLLDNPPSDAGITAVLTRDSTVVPADIDGNVLDFSTAGGKMNVYNGNTLVSDGLVTYSVTTSLGCAATILATGQYSITAMSEEYASVTFRATYAGVNRDKRFSIAKARSGFAGDNGLPGSNSATVNIYQRSATTPSLPSGTQTYTFSTTALTGLNNGWTKYPPVGTDPLWVAAVSFVSTTDTDTCLGSEWAGPVILVSNGTDGLNVATVFLFQRTATNTPPALPSAAVTYTFGTGVATGLTNGWTQTMPATGGAYRWITTATAISTGASDSIPTTEWAAANIIAQDGTDGQAGLNTVVLNLYKRSVSAPSGLTGPVTYTFATAIATGLTNGWLQTIPAGTDPIWCISGSAVSAGTTDTIAAAEFTSPVKLAESGTGGADGINTATVFLFQRTASSTPPAKPTAAVTYTFTTAVAAGLTEGWSQTLPTSGGQYCWVTTATAASQSASDTIATTEWATVAALAVDGANGQNSATVNIFKRGTTSPALPTATVTYTFATATLTGLDNGWTTSVPAGTDPLWVAVVSFVNSGATDTATSGEWSTPVKLVENGTNGLNSATVFLYRRTTTDVAPALPSATVTYTFATGVATGLTNSWTQGVPDPSGGRYLWITTASCASTGATDTIGTGEWATVRRLAADGIDGNDGIDAKSLGLYCTTQLFSFDSDNATPVPTAQTLTATLVLNNISGTATFTCTRYDAAGASLGTVTMGGSGNTRTLTVAQFGTAHFCEITATLGGYTDTARIIRVFSGANGTSPVASDLDNDTHTFPADSTGQVTSYVGGATRMRVYLGIVEDSTNWTYSRVVSAGVTATLGTGSDKNLLTVTAFDTNTAAGYVDITASRSGYPTQTKRFSVTKAKSAPNTDGLLIGQSIYSMDMEDTATNLAAEASVTLHTDGGVSRRSMDNIVTDKSWYAPESAGIGSNYWVRAVASGPNAANVNGTFGTWLALSTQRAWTMTLPGTQNGEWDATVTLSFSNTAAGTTLLGTMRLELGAHRPL